ncbi:MAG: hypothetical protein GX802_01605 [Clostridiales bacterium]|nr:hypothetical protein [Clostridiales bacterium]
MKRKVFYLIICVIILSSFSRASFANPGPYPALIFDFKGLEGEKYYLTLLSETDYKYEEYIEGDEDFFVYQKFLSFSDIDGFKFSNRFFLNPDDSYFKIEKNLPQRFKILLYFPKYDSFAISDKAYGQYAFDSYYSIDATELPIQSAEQTSIIKSKKQNSLTWELLTLSFKMLIIIAIKVFVALVCGFRKKELIFVAMANAFALTALSILVNLIRYNFGLLGFIMLYLILIILIVIFESMLYSKELSKYSGEEHIETWRIVLYALLANVVTFFIGFNSFIQFITRT